MRLQTIHDGHQLIHPGHDPMLLGEGWDRHDRRSQLRSVEVSLPALLDNLRLDLSLSEIRGVHRDTEKRRAKVGRWKSNADEIGGKRRGVVPARENSNLAHQLVTVSAVEQNVVGLQLQPREIVDVGIDILQVIIDQAATNDVSHAINWDFRSIATRLLRSSVVDDQR